MLTSAGRVWVSPQGAQSLGSILTFLCCSSSLGVAYTSECFPCKPGTYADQKGSSCCKLCPANSYSNKGETSCHQCDPDKYSGDVSEGGKSSVGGYQHIHRDRQEVEPSFWPSWRRFFSSTCFLGAGRAHLIRQSLLKWNHSVSIYQASTICQAFTLGVWNTSVKKIDQGPCLHGIYILECKWDT